MERWNIKVILTGLPEVNVPYGPFTSTSIASNCSLNLVKVAYTIIFMLYEKGKRWLKKSGVGCSTVRYFDFHLFTPFPR